MESVDIGLQGTKRFQRFCTPETLPSEWFNRYAGTVVELNAGISPFGITIAKKHPRLAVISQDVKMSSKNKVRKWVHQQGLQTYPDNFIYYIGDARVLLAKNTKAIVSLYPSNLKETLGWLPQIIEEAVAMNPDVYVAIVTETMQGKLMEELDNYSLAEQLQKTWRLDGKAKSSTLSLEEAEKIFVQTEYSSFLRRLAQNATLIEINADQRRNFL